MRTLLRTTGVAVAAVAAAAIVADLAWDWLLSRHLGEEGML